MGLFFFVVPEGAAVITTAENGVVIVDGRLALRQRFANHVLSVNEDDEHLGAIICLFHNLCSFLIIVETNCDQY